MGSEMGEHPKPAERVQARALRSELGLPMKEIARRLNVSVSSISLWTRDIEIEPEHQARNKQEAQELRSARWAELNRARRADYQAEGRAMARTGDLLHQAGCMLYWAEGGKDRNVACFSNSDVEMVRFFAGFLRSCLHLPPEAFVVRLNVYLGNGLSLRQVEDFWLSALELPRTCLRKHTINHFPTSSSGQKRNKLPHGVCSLVVNQTRVVQHILGAIQEYGGFDEPRWLDGPPRKPPPVDE
jgi:transposase-like protein